MHTLSYQINYDSMRLKSLRLRFRCQHLDQDELNEFEPNNEL